MEICSAYTGLSAIYPWKVYPKSGLKLFSISFNWIEKLNTIALKAFILSIGLTKDAFRIKGAAPKHLQYVYNTLSGFIAKVGKLILENSPEVIAFLAV